ncbi:type II toxin-antitoxin system Phd/YefM family antitoxin [Acinetobacter baumannii]|nr:type II toxin-antitoxin system Phd/YefM family antitoxin [Acinetobacter baumannii]EHU1539758.1 type II toxin-antitoxin system Phd/YefM family antitoxin [Acinetobacter baumannii]EHU2002713.1 type II toxin-antitoxin system Phd/YefM family antitoxin [Acinetobacter baumannii]
MQVITAKDAKSRFGELLDTMQREPVLVTKNKRPVGVFLSLKDVKGTHLESLFDVQEGDYEDWEKEKITEALNALKSHPSETKEMKSVHATAMQKARDLVASRKR